MGSINNGSRRWCAFCLMRESSGYFALGLPFQRQGLFYCHQIKIVYLEISYVLPKLLNVKYRVVNILSQQ